MGWINVDQYQQHWRFVLYKRTDILVLKVKRNLTCWETVSFWKGFLLQLLTQTAKFVVIIQIRVLIFLGGGRGWRIWGLSNPSSLQITNNSLLRTSTNYLRMLNQMNIFALETWSEQHICRGQEKSTGWKNILQQGVTVFQLGWDESRNWTVWLLFI
jgi:hypothetical protein